MKDPPVDVMARPKVYAGDEQYMLGEDEHIKEMNVCGTVLIINIYTVHGTDYTSLNRSHSVRCACAF